MGLCRVWGVCCIHEGLLRTLRRLDNIWIYIYSEILIPRITTGLCNQRIIWHHCHPAPSRRCGGVAVIRTLFISSSSAGFFRSRDPELCVRVILQSCCGARFKPHERRLFCSWSTRGGVWASSWNCVTAESVHRFLMRTSDGVLFVFLQQHVFCRPWRELSDGARSNSSHWCERFCNTEVSANSWVSSELLSEEIFFSGPIGLSEHRLSAQRSSDSHFKPVTSAGLEEVPLSGLNSRSDSSQLLRSPSSKGVQSLILH